MVGQGNIHRISFCDCGIGSLAFGHDALAPPFGSRRLVQLNKRAAFGLETAWMKMSGMHKAAAVIAIICLHALASVFLIFGLSDADMSSKNQSLSKAVPLSFAARPRAALSKDTGDSQSASKNNEDESSIDVAKVVPVAAAPDISPSSDDKSESDPAKMQTRDNPVQAASHKNKPANDLKTLKPAASDVRNKTTKVVASTEVKDLGASGSSKKAAASKPSLPSEKAGSSGKGGSKPFLPCASGGICDASSLAVIIRPDFVYPAVARRRGIQGRVILLLSVGADGKVMSSKVSDSSGFSILDASAAEYASKMVFGNPAETGIIVRLPVTYSLGQ